MESDNLSNDILPSPLCDKRGQSFIEFLLLLVIMVGISYAFLGGINKHVGERWKKIIELVADPTSSTISFD